MNKLRNFRLSLTAVLLALFLPLPALASENYVEPAPPLSLPEEAPEDSRDISRANAAYLPLKRIIPERGIASEEEQLSFPRLTDTELNRARELLSALETGQDISRKDQESTDKTRKASVSVYPLNPADFDGETFYVILPRCPLDDELLLSMIAEFDRLGISFDPDALNCRNCSRNCTRYGYSTRVLSVEENQRLQTIRRLIHRGILTRDKVPQDTGFVVSWTERTGHTDDFCLYPYRSMTDEELAALAFTQDTAWSTDPDLVEMNARKFAGSMISLPLSMNATMENEQDYGVKEYENDFELIYADGKSGITRLAERTEPVGLSVWHTEAPGREPSSFRMSVWYVFGMEVAEEHPGFTDADWIAAAEKWVAANLLLPEDSLPDNWKIISRSGGSVLLAASTRDWSFELSLNISDTFAESFHLASAEDQTALEEQ